MTSSSFRMTSRIPGLILVMTLLFSSCKKEGNGPSESLPAITTSNATGITDTSAVTGGNVTSDGGAIVTEKGVCWSTTENPTLAHHKTVDGDGQGAFTSTLRGLVPNTMYFVRAYATNSKGTAYGNQVSFTTLSPSTGTVTDVDGNVYKTVKIGSQVWMAENLRVTRYRNGDSIPNVVNPVPWATTTVGGCCSYDHDTTLARVYGRLYNFYAVRDPRNLAPAGWHIPTRDEWDAMVNGNGGQFLAGGYLKEAGNLHWNIPNHGAIDAFSFKALPGGNRNDLGAFSNLRSHGFWWTSTEVTGAGTFGTHFSMYTNTAYCQSANADRHMGFSVRCVKD